MDTKYITSMPSFPVASLDQNTVARRFIWQSVYGNNTVEAGGTNVSSIMHRMVKEAARVCDFFASDIYYAMKTLEECVESGTPMCDVLVMRQDGVNMYPAGCYDEHMYMRLNETYSRTPEQVIGTQLWLLLHTPGENPGRSTTLLRRVSLMFDFLRKEEMSFDGEVNKNGG